MIIYFIMLILIIVTALAVYSIKMNTKTKDKLFLMVSFILLTSVSAFRGNSVGTDTDSYITIFMRYVYGIHDPHSEIGFATLNEIIAAFTENPQIIIIVSSIIINLGLIVFIYHNSKMPWLSVYLYITLYYYFFSFNYMRQFIAISIILISWNFLKQRKFITFFILVILASTFHTLGLIGILLIVVYWKRMSTKIIPLIFGGTITVFLGMNLFLEYLFQIFPRYAYYGGDYLEGEGGIMIVVLYFSLFISTLILKQRNSSEEYNMLLIIASISAALSILGYHYYIFVRPALFFNVFSIIIIPELIGRFEIKIQVLILFVICSVALIYMFYYFSFNWHYILPYKFFF